ncbi:hypothetical protein [Lysobacter sp. Hz 25]|uniref:hypothetical protein n=1 Tax=Lysobacter sp. Hz 25 TaxID=3383698 RepID=UPI0038D3BCB2
MSAAQFLQLDELINRDDGDIPKDLVAACFESDSPGALGLAYDLIADAKGASRISPSLSFEEAHAFVRSYYMKCIMMDFDDVWADSSFSAQMDCKRWLAATWRAIDEVERDAWMLWVMRLSKSDAEAADQLSSWIRTL